MAFRVHPKAFHSFLIHHQALLALEEAVVYGMRADLQAVLAITQAEFVQITLEMCVVIVFDDLFRVRKGVVTSTRASRVSCRGCPYYLKPLCK